MPWRAETGFRDLITGEDYPDDKPVGTFRTKKEAEAAAKRRIKNDDAGIWRVVKVDEDGDEC